MEDNKIMYVKETYIDEERTLSQVIVYSYGDFREREYIRSKLNPHVTKLVRTEYLNKEWKVINNGGEINGTR